MSFLRRQKVVAPPRPVDPADTANRIDQARQKRLKKGGQASSFLSNAVAEAATSAAPPSLTGIG